MGNAVSCPGCTDGKLPMFDALVVKTPPPPNPPMPHPKEVHKAYLEMLTWRGLEPQACAHLGRIETPESQWHHVCLANLVLTAATNPAYCVEQILTLQYRRDVVLDNLSLLRTFIARSTKTWVAVFMDVQGLDALQLFLPQPTSPILEFNTTRGHASLQVVWHLCHFQSALLCLTQAESRGCLLSLCLCLSARPVALKLKAVRILHLVCLASPQGIVAVVKALQELDSITLVVHVVADLMHETASLSLLEEVFRLLQTLMLHEHDPWLRQVLTESDTCASLVDFHACRRDAATVQLQAAECRDLMKKAPTMVYTLHQLMARAKHAKTEHVLIQIAQTLIELTSGDPAAWQEVVAHLTAPQFTPPTVVDAATTPPPSPPPSTPPSPRPTLRSAELIAVEDHPKYAKYFKMLQVRVPEDLVRQRMIADSVDDRILDSPHLVVSAVDVMFDTEPSPPVSLPPTPRRMSVVSNPQVEDHKPLEGAAAAHHNRHGILSDIHCTQVLSVLAKLPWPLAQLGHVIQSGDETTLTTKVVDKLLVLLAIPSTLEKEAIQSILQGSHHSTCRDAERAVAVVLALAELIKCWQIYWQFPTNLQDFQAKCTWMQDACDELIKSMDLFEVIQIGCALEESTAFEWRFLALDDANYPGLVELAQAVRLRAPHLLHFGQSLSHLPKAVDINYDDLHATLATQQAKLDTVVGQLPTLAKHPWAAFVESASAELDNCKLDLQRAGALLEDTVSRCFGRCGQFPLSKFFVVLHRLSTTFAEADPTNKSILKEDIIYHTESSPNGAVGTHHALSLDTPISPLCHHCRVSVELIFHVPFCWQALGSLTATTMRFSMQRRG